MKVKAFGIYNLTENFLDEQYPDFYPSKRGRPFVLVFQDKQNQDVLWAVPISKAEKYKKILEKYPANVVEYDLPKYKSYILIQNIVPCTLEDIQNEYKVAGIHLCIKSKKKQHEIANKANKILSLIKRDQLKAQLIVKDMYFKICYEEALEKETHQVIEDMQIKL